VRSAWWRALIRNRVAVARDAAGDPEQRDLGSLPACRFETILTSLHQADPSAAGLAGQQRNDALTADRGCGRLGDQARRRLRALRRLSRVRGAERMGSHRLEQRVRRRHAARSCTKAPFASRHKGRVDAEHARTPRSRRSGTGIGCLIRRCVYVATHGVSLTGAGAAAPRWVAQACEASARLLEHRLHQAVNGRRAQSSPSIGKRKKTEEKREKKEDAPQKEQWGRPRKKKPERKTTRKVPIRG